MTHLFVHGFGVLIPEMLLLTVTLVPDGVKFTLRYQWRCRPWRISPSVVCQTDSTPLLPHYL